MPKRLARSDEVIIEEDVDELDVDAQLGSAAASRRSMVGKFGPKLPDGSAGSLFSDSMLLLQSQSRDGTKEEGG